MSCVCNRERHAGLMEGGEIVEVVAKIDSFLDADSQILLQQRIRFALAGLSGCDVEPLGTGDQHVQMGKAGIMAKLFRAGLNTIAVDGNLDNVVHRDLSYVIDVMNVIVVAVAKHLHEIAVFSMVHVASVRILYDKAGTFDPADSLDQLQYKILFQRPDVQHTVLGAENGSVAGNEIDVIGDRPEKIQHTGILSAAAGTEADADFLQIFDDLEVFVTDFVGAFRNQCAVNITCN